MSFKIPEYHHPDFTKELFVNAPDAKYQEADMDGVAPDHYHSTSMYPEYFKINGKWILAEESRMDSSVVLCDDGHLEVVENRNIKKGDKVILGRTESVKRGSICTAMDLSRKGSSWRTSLYSAREEAVRLPTPATMTTCLNC